MWITPPLGNGGKASRPGEGVGGVAVVEEEAGVTVVEGGAVGGAEEGVEGGL